MMDATTNAHPDLTEIEALTARLTNAVIHLNKINDDVEAWYDRVKPDGDSDMQLRDTAVAFFGLKEAHAELDKAVKRLYHVKDGLDKYVIPAMLDASGMDRIRVPEIGRSFGTTEKMSASFLDKEAGFEWLRSIGQGDLIQETVNAGTLASFCRNLILEEGIEPPEETVKLSTYKTTSVTKYTPKATVGK